MAKQYDDIEDFEDEPRLMNTAIVQSNVPVSKSEAPTRGMKCAFFVTGLAVTQALAAQANSETRSLSLMLCDHPSDCVDIKSEDVEFIHQGRTASIKMVIPDEKQREANRIARAMPNAPTDAQFATFNKYDTEQRALLKFGDVIRLALTKLGPSDGNPIEIGSFYRVGIKEVFLTGYKDHQAPKYVAGVIEKVGTMHHSEFTPERMNQVAYAMACAVQSNDNPTQLVYPSKSMPSKEEIKKRKLKAADFSEHTAYMKASSWVLPAFRFGRQDIVDGKVARGENIVFSWAKDFAFNPEEGVPHWAEVTENGTKKMKLHLFWSYGIGLTVYRRKNPNEKKSLYALSDYAERKFEIRVTVWADSLAGLGISDQRWWIGRGTAWSRLLQSTPQIHSCYASNGRFILIGDNQSPTTKQQLEMGTSGPGKDSVFSGSSSASMFDHGIGLANSGFPIDLSCVPALFEATNAAISKEDSSRIKYVTDMTQVQPPHRRQATGQLAIPTNALNNLDNPQIIYLYECHHNVMTEFTPEKGWTIVGVMNGGVKTSDFADGQVVNSAAVLFYKSVLKRSIELFKGQTPTDKEKSYGPFTAPDTYALKKMGMLMVEFMDRRGIVEKDEYEIFSVDDKSIAPQVLLFAMRTEYYKKRRLSFATGLNEMFLIDRVGAQMFPSDEESIAAELADSGKFGRGVFPPLLYVDTLTGPSALAAFEAKQAQQAQQAALKPAPAATKTAPRDTSADITDADLDAADALEKEALAKAAGTGTKRREPDSSKTPTNKRPALVDPDALSSPEPAAAAAPMDTDDAPVTHVVSTPPEEPKFPAQPISVNFDDDDEENLLGAA